MMSENLQDDEKIKRHLTNAWGESELHLPHRGSTEQAQPEELDPNYRILRRRGDAKPARMENVPIGMARCQECGALIPRSRLDEHIEKAHRKQEDVSLEKCPFCDARVRSDRLEKHVQKVHPDA